MKNKLTAYLLIILAAVGTAYLLRVWNTEREARVVLQQENARKAEEVQRLKEDVAKLEKTLLEEKAVGTPPPPERLAEVFGTEAASPAPAEKSGLPDSVQKLRPEEVASLKMAEVEMSGPPPRQLDCDALDLRIKNFFSYLDTKGFSFENGSLAYFRYLMDKLAGRLPIAGETLNPEDVLSNSYHFYRTLGKNDIRSIKEVFGKEKDTMEQIMDYLYQHHARCQDREQFLPSLDVLYEYGRFLLSAMGGRSYLFRLGGNLRVVLQYYSAMIVHEADLQEVNRYGLDLRPYLSKLEVEIKNTRGLYLPEKYLYMVNEAKRSYRPEPPG